MKESDRRKLLEATAYHEAGHAVACYLLHKRFKYITIRPQEEKLGEIIYPGKISKSIPSERELRVMKRDYMVFFAGPMAEGILSRKCEFKDILLLLSLHSSQTDDERKSNKPFWKLVFVETKLLIYAPCNWQAVIALAKELLTHEKIRYQAARKIIREAIEDYHEGVRKGIDNMHHSSYSHFVKRIAGAKLNFKERVRKITLEIMGRQR